MVIAVATAAFVLGFLIGLFTFHVKSRWCPECGATTTPWDTGQPATMTPHDEPEGRGDAR